MLDLFVALSLCTGIGGVGVWKPLGLALCWCFVMGWRLRWLSVYEFVFLLPEFAVFGLLLVDPSEVFLFLLTFAFAFILGDLWVLSLGV